MERALVTKRVRIGRRVARQPAMIPAPGSMVDHMATFVEFPGKRC